MNRRASARAAAVPTRSLHGVEGPRVDLGPGQWLWRLLYRVRATGNEPADAGPGAETRGCIKPQGSRVTPSRLRTGATCESWSAS
jgi:hypothetical protein